MKWLILLLGTLTILSCSSLFSSKSEEDDKFNALETTEPAATITSETTSEPKDIKVEPALKPKKRILVLGFINKSFYGGKELGQHAANDIKDMLSKTLDFYPVPEEELEGYEGFVTSSNTFNYRTIFASARSHGIAALVTGVIEDLQIQERGDEIGLLQTRYHTVTANLKYQVYETATEKLLLAKASNAQITEEHTRLFGHRSPDSYDSNRGLGAVSTALEKTYPQLLIQAKKIAWVGRIAKTDLQHYYINGGELSGISR